MSRQIKKFKVRDEDLWYWVYVYSDKQAMRLDAAIYKLEDSDVQDADALCQPVERLLIQPNKPAVRYGNVGIIRVMDDVGGAVSSHELLHGAMHIYRLRNDYKADFGDNNGEKEEELCYILTSLIHEFGDKMYKFGIWK